MATMTANKRPALINYVKSSSRLTQSHGPRFQPKKQIYHGPRGAMENSPFSFSFLKFDTPSCRRKKQKEKPLN